VSSLPGRRRVYAIAAAITVWSIGEAWIRRDSTLPAGSFLKLYFSSARGLSGTAFGLPPSRTALAAYVELLEGTGLPWAASAVGDDLVRSELCRAALDAGGHLHVGLEFYAGDRTPTNVELVTEAVEAAATAGREVATSAAAVLGLPRRTVESAAANRHVL
jgi:hypothetical protein